MKTDKWISTIESLTPMTLYIPKLLTMGSLGKLVCVVLALLFSPEVIFGQVTRSAELRLNYYRLSSHTDYNRNATFLDSGILAFGSLHGSRVDIFGRAPGGQLEFKQSLGISGISGFGYSVAGDNGVLAVSAPSFYTNTTFRGAVFIYEKNADGNWIQQAKILKSSGFGYGLDIEGDTLVVGWPNGLGIYVRDGSGAWNQEAYFNVPAQTVALSGDRIIAGGQDEHAYIYRRLNNGDWVEDAVFEFTTYESVSDVDIFGDIALVGMDSDGWVHAMRRNQYGQWVLEDLLVPCDGQPYDYFGVSVELSGSRAVIGAHAGEAAYVFERSADGEWLQNFKLIRADNSERELFGQSVSISGDSCVSYGGLSGAAYFFESLITTGNAVRVSGDLNFGELVSGQSSNRTMTITNPGSTSLNVNSVAYPEGFSGDWSGGILPAGSSQQINVTFSPSVISNYEGVVSFQTDANFGCDALSTRGAGIYYWDVVFSPGLHGTFSSGSITQSVKSGTAAIAPMINANPQWTFVGWDTDFSSVTNDLVITAQYQPQALVVFDSGIRGQIISGVATQYVDIGTSAVEPLVDGYPGWDFSGWDSDFSSVSGDMTVTALYDPKPLVVFSAGAEGMIGSGVVSQYVFYGESAVAPTVVPNQDRQFLRWNIGYTNVTQDILVSAQYAVKPLVIFDSGAHGAIISGSTNQYLIAGQNAVAPTVQTDPEWYFIGWDTAFTNVTSNLVVTAQYVPKPLVIFYAGAHGTITSGSTNQYLVPGGNAVEPAVQADPTWYFTGWDQAFTNVTSNLVVTAQYVAKPLVVFDAGAHGTISSGSTNQYVIPGAAAIAPAIQADTYWHFIGWDKSYASVVSNMTVTAQYVPYPTVTFDAGDHGVITSGSALQRVIPGGSASSPSVTADPHWTFTGWDGSLYNIQQDKTLTAQYSFTLPDTIFHEPIDAFTSAPSYVTAYFRLTDLSGLGLDIPASMVKAPDFFTVLEDGSPISASESYLQVDKMAEIEDAQLQTVLMIDNSFSVFPQLADIKAAAKTIVNNAADKQVFSIYSFSGPATNLQSFTSDKMALINAIDSIGLGSPSTDLHGSLITGLDQWEDIFTTNQVRRGFLVVLTDGDDQAGLHTTNDVLTARGDKQMFTIGLGSSVNMDVLSSFGNAGSYHVPNIADLPGVFLQIQRSIVNDANSFYWLQYVSPKRGENLHTLNATITSNPYSGSGSVLDVTFNSAGFADVAPAVVVNRSVFKPYGINSIALTNATSFEVQPYTILGFVDSSYSWQVADTSIVQVATSGGQTYLEPLGSGATTLLLTDVPNEVLIPGYGYYTRTLLVEVSNVIADLDNDGLPDSFEQLIVNASGGSITNISQVNPNDDFDGDGQSNLAEYIAGMDPTDPAAVFAATPPQLLPGGFHIVSWPSVQGRLYGVYWTDNLMNAFQALETDIPYPGNSYTDTLHSANSSGSYMIDVKLK